MQISKNIACILQDNNGIITFASSCIDEASSCIDEANVIYLIENILSKVKSKNVIKDVNPEWNFKDSIFYINLTELYMDAKNLKNYFNKLHTFCYENNNSVIILTITYNTFENNQHILKIRSNVLMYMSNMIFYINKGYIEVIKNTYVFQDIIEGNLTAFIRDEKINQILS